MAGEGRLGLWCFCFLVFFLLSHLLGVKDETAEEALWRPWQCFVLHSVASVALDFHRDTCSDEGGRRRERERERREDILSTIGRRRSVHRVWLWPYCKWGISILFHVLEGFWFKAQFKMHFYNIIQEELWNATVLLSFAVWGEKFVG